MSVKKANVSKPQTKKKTKQKRSLFQKILIVLITGTLLVGVSGFFMLSNIIADVLRDNAADSIMNQEPSPVYADDGTTKAGEFGGISRENVTYDQIPQSVIDAFLAIEDSRYFKHNGFDLPRFISSAITNLRSGSLAQGGSTLTMQLVDNAKMKPVEEAMAKEGKHFNTIEKIERKVQEIYLSMKLETDWTKELIITKYLNEINFGGGALGIQKAAQYYFGKDVTALNLSESAFLAGVINAPYNFNPYNGYSAYLGDESNGKYNFYEAATQRRDETLYMMKYHGYISETEYDLAKSTKLAFQLNDTSVISDNEKYKYYLTQVQQEVINLTGKDPATTPMKIYTSLNIAAQDEANSLASGNGVTLPNNQYYQLGGAMVNNTNGEIMAVIGGRTDIDSGLDTGEFRDRSKEPKQPGSTAKPLLDYAMAFEHLGWCTTRVMSDDGPFAIDSQHKVANSDGKYYGDVSLERALAQSLNTIALQTMDEYLNREGKESQIEYLKKLGLSDTTAEAFDIQYAIGGASLQLSPIELASAYAIFGNGGNYHKPHMVRKVVMEDGTTYETKTETTKALSEQAAFMVSDLLYKVVNGSYKGYNLLGMVDFSSYPVYGKTGTTNWSDEEAAKYGGAMKDEWTVTYTSEYTVATWTGFDYGVAGGNTNINDYLMMNVNTLINKALLDKCTTSNVKKIARPSGISEYGGGYIKTEFLKNAAKNNPKTVVNTTNETQELENLIKTIEALNSEEYTAESYERLLQALEKAKRVLEDDSADMDDVKQALSDLQAAYNSLEKNAPKVDNSALKNLIETAKTYVDTSKYNAAQVDALQKAISNGIQLAANSNATQAEIDAAVNAINIAIQDCINNPLPSNPEELPNPDTPESEDSDD